MKKKITVEFEDAFIEVCLLGEDYPMGYIYAGEIQPKPNCLSAKNLL